MNRFTTISIISAFALASIAGSALAAGMHSSAPGFIGESSTRADRLIRHWKGGQFYVMPLGQVYSNGEAAAVAAHAGERPQIAALQSAIEHNPTLASRLKAENIEISNIIDARAAMDGSLELYVR